MPPTRKQCRKFSDSWILFALCFVFFTRFYLMMPLRPLQQGDLQCEVVRVWPGPHSTTSCAGGRFGVAAWALRGVVLIDPTVDLVKLSM